LEEFEKKLEEDEMEIKRETLKVFHLDLKGAPPKMDYLINVLPLIRNAGANAILVEYEDMFPFWGRLKNISARNSYTRDEVKTFLKLAIDLKMEVIPLVQTFGHMEYVLKLAEFQHLRELDNFPQEICPSKNESFKLIQVGGLVKLNFLVDPTLCHSL
jgi:hexosaminidase